MSLDTSTVEMTDAGVNSQSTDSSVSASEESLTSAQNHDDSGSQDQESATQSQQKKSENRFQKLANENKRYKTDLQKLQSQLEKAQEALGLQEWLAADPRRIQALLALEGQSTTQEQSDPYAEYSPDVADRFRKLDMIEKYIEEQKQERKQNHEKSIAENRIELENAFEKALSEKGYIAKDGSFDQFEVGIIGKATLAEIVEISKNPEKPTVAELNQALSNVLSGMSKIERRGLKQTIKPQTMPPTGSRSGTAITKSGGRETDQQRIARIAAELGA